MNSLSETGSEKPQEQIVYENTCLNLCTGDYAQYLKHPQSVGAVCQWLKAFSFHNYDRVQIGFRNDIGTVNLGSNVIATFRFVEGVPVFSFREPDTHWEFRQNNYHACKDKYPNPFEQWKKQ